MKAREMFISRTSYYNMHQRPKEEKIEDFYHRNLVEDNSFQQILDREMSLLNPNKEELDEKPHKE